MDEQGLIIRLADATGLDIDEIRASDGDVLIDWIERVKALLPDDVMFADSGLPDPAVLLGGRP